MNTTYRILAASSVLVAVSLVTGCATRYQEIGTDVTGGFFSERISANQFSVGFAGNGFTSPKRASDFAVLRAAELTLEYGFSHFVVEGKQDLSTSEVVHMGSTSTTSGTVSPYGYSGVTQTTHNTTSMFKPGSALTITCYDGRPKDKHVGRVYDARKLVAELRAKYKLK